MLSWTVSLNIYFSSLFSLFFDRATVIGQFVNCLDRFRCSMFFKDLVTNMQCNEQDEKESEDDFIPLSVILPWLRRRIRFAFVFTNAAFVLIPSRPADQKAKSTRERKIQQHIFVLLWISIDGSEHESDQRSELSFPFDCFSPG